MQLVLWFKAAPVVGGVMTPSHLGAATRPVAQIFTRGKRGAWACYALVPSALDALSAVLSTTR